jgi:hypothetical protein
MQIIIFGIDYRAPRGVEPHVAPQSRRVYLWYCSVYKVILPRISLPHNCALSLWNVYCSVKYERAKVCRLYGSRVTSNYLVILLTTSMRNP